jgi:RNA polymerase sigma-70 factor (sigma-E family)
LTTDDEFAAFVHQATPSLFATAMALTRDRNLADDLLQDVWIRIYPRWERVQQLDSPYAYVRRSVVNRYLSVSRRIGEFPVAEIPDSASVMQDHAEASTDRALVEGLLAQLPQKQQAALVLRYLEDLTDVQIGAAIGCRPSTARSLIFRGIVSLRTRLARAEAQRRSHPEEVVGRDIQR